MTIQVLTTRVEEDRANLLRQRTAMINRLIKVIYCKIEHYTYYIPKAADWIVQA